MNKFIANLLARIGAYLEPFGIHYSYDPQTFESKEKRRKHHPSNTKKSLPKGAKPKISRHEQHK